MVSAVMYSVMVLTSCLWFCYAVRAAFVGLKDKCTAYPLRAVKKAFIYGGSEYPKDDWKGSVSCRAFLV